jgi:hypothetical protein
VVKIRATSPVWKCRCKSCRHLECRSFNENTRPLRSGRLFPGSRFGSNVAAQTLETLSVSSLDINSFLPVVKIRVTSPDQREVAGSNPAANHHDRRPVRGLRSFALRAQDFACGLERPQSGSSSNPATDGWSSINGRRSSVAERLSRTWVAGSPATVLARHVRA